ncbi:MAG: hypothetical protein HQL99_03880 [Magnetococcales bacterium]|nr:hypothetical protein [Magnetococcales bacterium]
MELVYFTIIGGALYLLSDRMVNRIEERRGARLPYRSLIFFAIIFSLSLFTFSVMRAVTEPPPESPAEAGQDATTIQPPKTAN